MNQVALQRKIEKYLSTRRYRTVQWLATELEMPESTVRYNLWAMSDDRVALCENPDAKPQKWYAVQPVNPVDMSLELAFVLKNVKETIKTMLPAALYREVEDVLKCANDTYQKKQLKTPHSTVVKFDRAIKNIDLNKHVVLGNVSADVLAQITESLYSESPIEIHTQKGEYSFKQISIFESEDQLFLRGKVTGFSGKSTILNAADIFTAKNIDDMPDWRIPNLAA
jgi:hypothetical protein